jgi:CBS domain-containing protein
MKDIGQIATSHATYTAKRGQTVREVVKYMSKAHVGAMPIIDRGRLAGIFTERDLMTRVVSAGRDPDRTKIDEVMTTDIVIANASETYEESLRTMKRVGCRHLPVVKNGRLVGMVSLRDLLQVDLEEKEETVRLMTSYVYYLPPGGGNA